MIWFWSARAIVVTEDVPGVDGAGDGQAQFDACHVRTSLVVVNVVSSTILYTRIGPVQVGSCTNPHSKFSSAFSISIDFKTILTPK